MFEDNLKIIWLEGMFPNVIKIEVVKANSKPWYILTNLFVDRLNKYFLMHGSL